MPTCQRWQSYFKYSQHKFSHKIALLLPPPFPLCVHKSLLHVCASLPALQRGSSLPYISLFKAYDHLKTTVRLVIFQTPALFPSEREWGVCYLNSGQNYWATGPFITDLWQVCTRRTARVGSQGDGAKWGVPFWGLFPILALPLLLPLRHPTSLFKAHHWGKVTVPHHSDARGNSFPQSSRPMPWPLTSVINVSLPDNPVGLASRVPPKHQGAIVYGNLCLHSCWLLLNSFHSEWNFNYSF